MDTASGPSRTGIWRESDLCYGGQLLERYSLFAHFGGGWQEATVVSELLAHMLNYLFYPEGRIRTGSRIDDFHDTIASYFLDAWSPTASSLVLSFLNLFFSKWSHSIFVAFWDLVSS